MSAVATSSSASKAPNAQTRDAIRAADAAKRQAAAEKGPFPLTRKIFYAPHEWTALSKEERDAVFAERKRVEEEKRKPAKEKAEHDKFIREHPNALVRVITQEEADKRNALRAKNAKNLEKIDKAFGIVREPVKPGIVRSVPVESKFQEGPPYYLPQTSDQIADENLMMFGILGGSTTTGAGIGATVGNVVPGIGNVVGGVVGAAAGSIVGMVGCYFHARNNEIRRRR